MASLGDIFTTAKNIVTAINGWSQTTLQVEGNASATEITEIAAAALVKIGEGRIARVSVIVGGSAVGYIHDAILSTASGPRVYTIPNTVGVYEVNMPVSSGIVVAPGTGQTVSISYS